MGLVMMLPGIFTGSLLLAAGSGLPLAYVSRLWFGGRLWGWMLFHTLITWPYWAAYLAVKTVEEVATKPGRLFRAFVDTLVPMSYRSRAVHEEARERAARFADQFRGTIRLAGMLNRLLAESRGEERASSWRSAGDGRM